MILFGEELVDFANFGRSTNAVFRLMLGDFDWEALYHVGRPHASLWFWSFTWLVNLIMLNMLLAIIMDIYTDVKGNIGHSAETMLSQAIEIIQRKMRVRS